jgi:bifunctional non-homologous end joining protein LigD
MTAQKDARTILAGGRRIELSNPSKVLFPDDGFTKANLAEYYAAVAPVALPHARGRPVMMERYPDGIAHRPLIQQNAPDYFPEWIQRVHVPKDKGNVRHPLIGTAAAFVYLANQACVTPHVWLSRSDKIFNPDQLIFDLDPPKDGYEEARRTALQVRDLLAELGLTALVRTSGGKGLHVLVPLDRSESYQAVRPFAEKVAAELERRDPERLTTEFRKEARRGRLFLDVTRNAYAQTTPATYAVRALPGAPVATPLDWSEVEDAHVTPGRFTIRTVPRRLDRDGDPWKGLARKGRSLRQARNMLAKTG